MILDCEVTHREDNNILQRKLEDSTAVAVGSSGGGPHHDRLHRTSVVPLLHSSLPDCVVVTPPAFWLPFALPSARLFHRRAKRRPLPCLPWRLCLLPPPASCRWPHPGWRRTPVAEGQFWRRPSPPPPPLPSSPVCHVIPCGGHRCCSLLRSQLAASACRPPALSPPPRRRPCLAVAFLASAPQRFL